MSARAKWAVVVATLVLGGSVAATACTCELPLFGGDEPETANLWVDDDGGTCARSATRAEYSDSAACSTFASAYSAAVGGDTVRIRAATYDGPQRVGGPERPHVTFRGRRRHGRRHHARHVAARAGAPLQRGRLERRRRRGHALRLIGGNGSTWPNSTLLESSDDDCCARGITGVTTPEPILIYDDTVSSRTPSSSTS